MDYVILREKTFDRLRAEIKKAKSYGKIPMFISVDDDLIRKISEKENGIVIVPELKNKQDRLYERGSGFDLVVAEFCKKNKHVLGILLDEVLESGGTEKGKMLARMKQNVKVAKKAKLEVRFVLASDLEIDKKNLFSFGLILSMDPKMAKGAAEGFLKLHQL